MPPATRMRLSDVKCCQQEHDERRCEAPRPARVFTLHRAGFAVRTIAGSGGARAVFKPGSAITRLFKLRLVSKRSATRRMAFDNDEINPWGCAGWRPQGKRQFATGLRGRSFFGRNFKPMNQRTFLADSGFTSARRRPDSMHIRSQTYNLPRSFLRENSEAKTSNPTSMKGREPRQPHE